MTSAIQFIGIEPTTLIQETAQQVFNLVIPEIYKTLQNNSPEYLSAEQVCKRLDITKPTLHEWKKRKIIRSFKLGARVYYRWDEVQGAMIIN
ncbi:helix-turn-helix domain-containing protein [Chryseobacterium lathyri]|uniref:Helix-turn-helix domain-containing protein n=1 Tax=Chryseobacterium lathyri TaxID=395933 RepID=A0ABT9SR47_9FLAO|nr:helix-turn-helix domain-containing protein [Chryseobacterium lathyri]MDP9961271.1 hypothetical protein [Chryseobacterium lathyri]